MRSLHTAYKREKPRRGFTYFKKILSLFLDPVTD